MEYRILGSLEVWAGARQIPLRGGRQEKVLATLLLADSQVVSLDYLINCVWEDVPPNTAAKQVRNTVSELRRILGADSASFIPTTAGYRLELGTGTLDSALFAHRVEQARRYAARNLAAEAVAEYRQGLALWRGSALLGLQCSALEPQVTGLNEQRLAALEDCVSWELTLGHHQAVAGELPGWVGMYPLRERLAGQLMLASYRCGRQADALAVYDGTQQALTVELGIDPGPELQDLRHRILTNDTLLIPQTPDDRPTQRARCDLPGDVGHFTGRIQELRHLINEFASDTALSNGGAVIISAIDGMAGVGKTTLAVHAAHRLTEQYPDGQLFIDLHAHTPGQQNLTPAAALDRLLRAIGVSGEKIPQGLEERSALWRACLADRRILIILDNVANTAQVRPLLPGTATCLTLVTSRNRLTSLEHARLLSLDVLPLHDARDLFSRVVADDRPAMEPDARDTILELCGRLPLAICIAAARLRHRSAWTVSYLAERLLDDQRRLGELQAEDRSVVAAFDLSYQHLGVELQQFFRLLGLVPGRDLDRHAAAALTGLPLDHAEKLLEQLVDAHLLEQPTPGRYRFHDLLRTYAAQLPTPATVRHTALAGLLDYYLTATSQAMDVVTPYEKHRRPPAPAPKLPVPDMATYDRALNWLDTEFPNILAAVRFATIHGWETHACRLSITLWRYVHIRDSHEDGLVLHTHARNAARTIGDPTYEAHALTNLGDNHWWLGHFQDAVTHHELALSLTRTAPNPIIESRALHGLGLVTWRLGDYTQALTYFRRTLDLARTIRDRNIEGYALRGLGITNARLGNYDQARNHFQRALNLARTAHHLNIESRALRGLGEVSIRVGQYEHARTYLQQAHDLARGTSSDEASILHGLGLANALCGNRQLARQQFQRALEIAQDLHYGVLEAEILNSQGDIARLASRFEEALEYHRSALALASKLGDRYESAHAHNGASLTCDELGQAHDALRHREQALILYTMLGVPEAGYVRARQVGQ